MRFSSTVTRATIVLSFFSCVTGALATSPVLPPIESDGLSGTWEGITVDSKGEIAIMRISFLPLSEAREWGTVSLRIGGGFAAVLDEYAIEVAMAEDGTFVARCKPIKSTGLSLLITGTGVHLEGYGELMVEYQFIDSKGGRFARQSIALFKQHKPMLAEVAAALADFSRKDK
jgi:hypothetical protein